MVVALATFDLIFFTLSDVRPGLVICCSYGFLSVFFNAIQINDGYSFILLPIDGHQLVLFCLIFKSSSLWVTFVMNLNWIFPCIFNLALVESFGALIVKFQPEIWGFSVVALNNNWLRKVVEKWHGTFQKSCKLACAENSVDFLNNLVGINRELIPNCAHHNLTNNEKGTLRAFIPME